MIGDEVADEVADKTVDNRRVNAPPGWAEVYEAHALRLTRLATMLVGAADAHDLVSEAVQRAVSAPAWLQVEQPAAYLSQTLVHLADDRRRSDGRRARRERTAADVVRVLPLPDVESTMVVRSALSALTPPQLAIVYLHYWEDLTVDQAAAHLGMRVGTARTHFDRAKRTLRVALASEQGGRR